MRNNIERITVRMMMLLWVVLISLSSYSQTYFKSLGAAASSYNLKVTHFNNGDLLLGDSDLQGLEGEESGKVLLTRLDNCGNVIWSHAYTRENEYLEFKDFVVNDLNEIYVFGSAFRGFDELIFLLKVNGNGELTKFALFVTESVDRFSYSMDIEDDRLMIYGLLLDFNTKKEGFVAVFDLGLNFTWGKKFTPFESNGDAIICRDGGFICWSGAFFYKLNPEGLIEWALEGDIDAGFPPPLAGPVEINAGFVFQGYDDGASFFFLLDHQGDLQWQSGSISTARQAADLIPLNDGSILVTYTGNTGRELTLSRLTLDPRGNISEQKRLAVNSSYQPETLNQSLRQGHLAILVNGAIRPDYPIDVEDFLIHFDLTMENTPCLAWESYSEQLDISYPMNFMTIDTPVVATVMTAEPGNSSGFPQWAGLNISDQCDEPLQPEMTTVDSLIACDQDWEVILPSSDFQWDDMSGAPSPRILEIPGIYTASNRDCMDPMIYEYILQKPDCECDLYLANAFTPNNDGINDLLRIQGNCSLTEMQILIFDRWGNAVFEGRHPESAWDGNFKGQKLPAGVYLAQITYASAKQDGSVEDKMLTQEVILLR